MMTKKMEIVTYLKAKKYIKVTEIEKYTKEEKG